MQVALGVALVLVGCASGDAVQPTAAPTTPPPAPIVPPPTTITITNLGPGDFVIDNPTGTAQQIALAASLERLDAGQWSAIDDRLDLGGGYRLTESCAVTASPCIELAPGASLRPVPWTGMNCNAQCNLTCRANAFEPEGDYRLVVRTCDGTRLPGPTFALAPYEATMFERSGITSSITSVIASRADLPVNGRYDPNLPPDPDRIASLVPRDGSRVELDRGARDALVALMQDRTLDTQTLKRCRSDHHVAFVVTRELATTGAPRQDTVELSIDFTCDRVFAVTGGGARPRVVHAAFFDGSRDRWLAFARTLFPDDPELARLR